MKDKEPREKKIKEKKVKEKKVKEKKAKEKKVKKEKQYAYTEPYVESGEPDKIEIFLKRVEKRLVEIPVIGKFLSNLPIMLEMVRNYVIGKYRDVPVSRIIIIMVALFYALIIPDVINDWIPIIGYVDDVIVIAISLLFVDRELRKYKRWREL